MLRGISETQYRPMISGESRRVFCLVTWVLGCFLGAGTCLAQTGEGPKASNEKAERSGRPFARPIDPLIEGKFIRGTILTPEAENYQFVSAAGAMVYVTNLATKEEFSFVMAPIFEADSAGNAIALPTNTDANSDLTIRSFRIDRKKALVETGYSAMSTQQTEGYNDPGGSRCTIIARESFEFLVSKEIIHSGSTCCVSCGTYQICAASVTSSCGSCTAGGPGPQYKDLPRAPQF